MLSDWYRLQAFELSTDVAEKQLKTIFSHLDVVIPSFSMAQPFNQPTDNPISQPVVADEEKMEVSERKRLAFMVANTYQMSKTLKPLMGTTDSIHNVKEAIEQYGFQVFLSSKVMLVLFTPLQAQLNCDIPFEKVRAVKSKTAHKNV